MNDVTLCEVLVPRGKSRAGLWGTSDSFYYLLHAIIFLTHLIAIENITIWGGIAPSPPLDLPMFCTRVINSSVPFCLLLCKRGS